MKIAAIIVVVVVVVLGLAIWSLAKDYGGE